MLSLLLFPLARRPYSNTQNNNINRPSHRPTTRATSSKRPVSAAMDGFTELYRSQIGGASVINYGYTDMPLRLLCWDVYYFFVYLWALPWVLWPMFVYGSDEMDELYPTWMNAFCVLVHLLLAVLQVVFLIAIPFSVLLPVWMAAAAFGSFMLGNWLLCKMLNGKERTFHSDDVLSKEDADAHAHEQWVFVNGVAVGKHWFKNNLNRLAITFRRPILGIHNQTSGVIFDVVECLIQRNFNYATSDVRITYRLLKEVLYNPAKSKVVLILHSQGGIEGGLVLDWLLQEIPQDLLAKLEVYTFGNAANHFNNPHRHAFSQNLLRDKPNMAMRTLVTETSSASPATSPIDVKNDLSVKIPPALARETSSSLSASRTSSAAQDRAISHIEHYAHSTDFVAIWGVLHFATNHTKSRQIPRFLGRLFVRSTGKGGHQFNQHYLDGMFPLERDASGKFTGASEENPFMEEIVKLGKEGGAMENIREAFDITYMGTQGFGSGDVSTPVEVHGIPGKKKAVAAKDVKMKDISRLWSYRNGMSPKETPPMLVTEGGLARNATA